jgi:hypothetical protein
VRSGELLGLERGTAQEIAHVRDGDGNVLERHGRIVSDPKSEAGKRDVPLPPVVVDALRVHLDSYVAPDPHALVLTPCSTAPGAQELVVKDDLSQPWGPGEGP